MKTMKSSQRILHIDIETFCELDLTKTGVYAYASHPSFEILLFAYAYDDEPVVCLDLTVDEIPEEVEMDLFDSDVIKVAHNAQFEKVCLSVHTGIDMVDDQWECTMVMALQLGLPASLAQVASVLKLEQQKMTAGATLINYFSKPCKPTRSNNQRTRNLPHHDTEKWEVFMEYCARDVEVEQAIHNILSNKPTQPKFERDVYLLDQKINSTGIGIDRELVECAVDMDEKITGQMLQELIEITGKSNPKSVAQFKQYLQENGIEVKTLNKKDAIKLLDEIEDETIKHALELKLKLSKSSVAKYRTMIHADSGDHRLRGMFQYYGANRTGRWAGRLVQMQNLPQNHLDDLDLARDFVKNDDSEMIEYFYNSVPDTLSQLIRTAFIAKEGHTFIVADYSAIEARVIAWLADEKWRLKTFANKQDIYCASASQMFKVPVVKNGENGHLRQKGKIAELALGYGGGVGALTQMGALEMGIKETELQKLVDMWRAANPAITKLWREVGNAAIDAIEGEKVTFKKGIKMTMHKGDLLVKLPSGRTLVYNNAQLDNKGISYAGLNQNTKKWELVTSWGGKLVENIIQAIARDCLAIAMLRLDKEGYSIVGHVHDEVIIEAPIGTSVKEVCDVMALPLKWAKGLDLPAEGYETPYYKKDD